MVTIMHVLDGYPVQIHPGDKYSKTHLFIRGQYVHAILFTTEGRAFLKDADTFDGPRRDFTAEESLQLQTLYAEVQAEERTRQATKQRRQANAAQHAQTIQRDKLVGMDDVKIYD